MSNTSDSDEGRLTPAIDLLNQMTPEELTTLIEEALDRLSAEDLTAMRDAAEARRLERLEGEKNAVLEEMREKLARLGLTLEEAVPRPSRGPRKNRRDAGTTRPIRYRGPHGEGWSGKGRTPSWMVDLEAAGHSRDEFRVSEEAA